MISYPEGFIEPTCSKKRLQGKGAELRSAEPLADNTDFIALLLRLAAACPTENQK